MMARTLLIVGATGNQGGAAIDALLGDRRDWSVKALVRNLESEKAQALKQRGVELVSGDLNDAESIRHAVAGAYGVYSVQSPQEGGPEHEEKQGIVVADAAKEAGVSHFVYSSVAGAERKSGVPHFESKWRVEQHIASIGLPATIIRPALFMDNFATFKFRIIMLAMLRTFVPDNQKTQMVATRDIGITVAEAFAKPEHYVGRAIELAGDAVTRGELVRSLGRHGLRPAPSLKVPGWMRGQVPEEYQLMMQWIAKKGFQADIRQLRAEFPSLTTVDRWAQRVLTGSELPAPSVQINSIVEDSNMADYTIQELSEKMRDIDFAMLFTKSEGGEMAGRPMSNNGEVEYQGDSFFFAFDSTRTSRDIRREPKVGLSYQGSGSLFDKPPIFIAIEGDASLISDKQAFASRWSKDLERWFPQGTDTPGLVMIKVSATRIHYWDGSDEGELAMED